jgi:hypothetical protein
VHPDAREIRRQRAPPPSRNVPSLVRLFGGAKYGILFRGVVEMGSCYESRLPGTEENSAAAASAQGAALAERTRKNCELVHHDAFRIPSSVPLSQVARRRHVERSAGIEYTAQANTAGLHRRGCVLSPSCIGCGLGRLAGRGSRGCLGRIASNRVRTMIIERADRFARDIMVQETGYAMLSDRGTRPAPTRSAHVVGASHRGLMGLNHVGVEEGSGEKLLKRRYSI